MRIEELHELLGMTNTDQTLIAAIAEHGGNVAGLSAQRPTTTRSIGINGVGKGDNSAPTIVKT